MAELKRGCSLFITKNDVTFWIASPIAHEATAKFVKEGWFWRGQGIENHLKASTTEVSTIGFHSGTSMPSRRRPPALRRRRSTTGRSTLPCSRNGWRNAPSALSKGDIVITENLANHKGPRFAPLIKDAGAELRYLPPYSPDMNPIEKAYSKLKAHLRKIAERTVASLLRAPETCADIFKPAECENYSAAFGYDRERQTC